MKNKNFIIFFTVLWISKCAFSYDELSFTAENFRLGDNPAKDSSIYTLTTNPAGLWNIKVTEIFISYHILYPNLTDKTKFLNNTAGLSFKFLNSGIGFSFNQFGIEEWYIRDKIIISYGRILKEKSKYAFGIKFFYDKEKYYLDEYMIQNPVFLSGNEKGYFSLSLGGLYIFDQQNYFGLTIENINQPDTGFYTKELLPLVLNFGYRYKNERLKIYPSVKFDLSTKKDYITNLAFEYDFIVFDKIKLSPSFCGSYGSRDLIRAVLGFSIQTKLVDISYCFGLDLMNKLDFGGQHYISLNYRFVPIDIKEEKVSKEEYDFLMKEKLKLEQQIEELKKQIEEQKVLKEKILEKPQPTETQILPTSGYLEELLERLKKLEDKLKEKTNMQQQPTKTQQSLSVPSLQNTTPKKRYHKVLEGDTLPKLAEKYYGDPSLWKKIYNVNKDKIIRGQLIPGVELEIP